MLLLFIVYIVLCTMVGLCGMHRSLGFFGTFLLSMVLTPVVVLIILKLTGAAARPQMRYPGTGAGSG